MGQRAGWGGKEDPEERREWTKWERGWQAERGRREASPRGQRRPLVIVGGGPRAEGGGPRDLQSGAAEKEVRRGQRHREVERPKGVTEAET